MSNLPVVLCVDDEPNILSGLRRTLLRDASVITAQDGTAGLVQLEQRHDVAAIVSDMRMPGMDGAEFLERAREARPNATRLLLTGQADLEAAVRAVNNGRIHRFLTKPCDSDVLRESIRDAVRQHQLVTAEQELTQGTLRGVVDLAMDLLRMANPTAFGRAVRIQALVEELLGELPVEDRWEFHVAAALSQVGTIALSDHLLSGARPAGSVGTPAELREQTEVGASWIERIPRLGDVAEIIARQHDRHERVRPSGDPDLVAVGAGLLQVAVAFDRLVDGGEDPLEAARSMASRPGAFHPEVVTILVALQERKQARARAQRTPDAGVRTVELGALRPGMVLAGDVHDQEGFLLFSAGHALTETLCERLVRIASRRGLSTPIEVRPQDD